MRGRRRFQKCYGIGTNNNVFHMDLAQTTTSLICLFHGQQHFMLLWASSRTLKPTNSKEFMSSDKFFIVKTLVDCCKVGQVSKKSLNFKEGLRIFSTSFLTGMSWNPAPGKTLFVDWSLCLNQSYPNSKDQWKVLLHNMSGLNEVVVGMPRNVTFYKETRTQNVFKGTLS